MGFIVMAILTFIALGIIVVINDFKYPLYTSTIDGVKYHHIRIGNIENEKYHIMRSTKDISFILVSDKEFKNKFYDSKR